MKKFFKRAFVAASLFFITLGVVSLLVPTRYAPFKPLVAVFKPDEVAFGKKQEMYLLLLGVDYNYDNKAQRHTKNARSDTILVVRLEPRGRHLSMLSLPRDLLVPIGKNGRHGYDKINAAFSLGGVDLTRETVEGFLGKRIDHHIVVKSDVVEQLVDDLGGVKVDVETDMDYDDNWAGLHIHLKKGEQTLSGNQAVGYCRWRGGWDGDLGRIRRQQQFLVSLVKELKSREHWTDYPKLGRTVAQKMETDLKKEQIVGLANLYKSFPLSRLEKGRIEVADYFEGGISYLVPVAGEPKSTMTVLFPELPPAELSKIDVVIEDYRKVRRSTRRVINRYRDGGFGAVKYVRYRPVEGGNSEIVLRGISLPAKRALERLFPDLPIKEEESLENPSVLMRLFTPAAPKTS